MATSNRLFTRTFTLVWIAGLLQELAWSVMIHFPGFLSDLGASETRIGLLYSLSAVAGLTLRPVLGRLIDNVGRRPVLLTAGMLNAAAVAAMIGVDDLTVFLVFLFVGHRVFQIAIFTAMLTLSADVLPIERRMQGLAIYGLGGLFPMATGGAIGDLLLGLGDFDLLFLCAASVSVLSWLMVWLVPPQPNGGSGGPRRGFWAALGQRNLLPVWLLTLLFAAGLEALFTFIRTYVDERGIGSVGAFFLVYGGVAIVVRLTTSSRLDRFQQLPLIVGSMSLFAIGIIGLGLASSLNEMIAASACLGIGHGLMFPIITAQVVTRARDSERGSAMAIFTSLFDLAVLTAAPIVGVVIDTSGYTTAFVGTGVAVALGLVFYTAWERAIAADRERIEVS